jgi:hypothetical protein
MKSKHTVNARVKTERQGLLFTTTKYSKEKIKVDDKTYKDYKKNGSKPLHINRKEDTMLSNQEVMDALFFAENFSKKK